MSRAKGILSGGRVLANWVKSNASQGRLIQSIIDGVNTVADNTASSAVGRLAPPPPINGVSVKVSPNGEQAHIQIADNGNIQQGIRYFTEIANNENFSQPIVIDHGTSRTSHPITLPTQDDDGSTHNWFARSYSQLPGSDPSPPVVYGGKSPTSFTMNGSTKLTLLPSTGSGTAANNGQQGGSGLGKQLRRNGN